MPFGCETPALRRRRLRCAGCFRCAGCRRGSGRFRCAGSPGCARRRVRQRFRTIEVRREIAFAEGAALKRDATHRLDGLAAFGALVHAGAGACICWSEAHRKPLSLARSHAAAQGGGLRPSMLSLARTIAFREAGGLKRSWRFTAYGPHGLPHRITRTFLSPDPSAPWVDFPRPLRLVSFVVPGRSLIHISACPAVASPMRYNPANVKPHSQGVR